MKKQLCTTFMSFALLVSASIAQLPEGGSIYAMEKAVVAGGGAKSGTEATRTIEGTIGQSIAGSTSSAPFGLHAGFWIGDPLQPTAAPASISGRVNNLESLGIAARRIRVVVTNVLTCEVRSQPVGPFGYYEFVDLELTAIYQLRVDAPPSIAFEPESLTLRLVDNVSGADFTAHQIQ